MIEKSASCGKAPVPNSACGHRYPLVSGIGYRVSGIGYRVSGIGYRAQLYHIDLYHCVYYTFVENQKKIIISHKNPQSKECSK